MKHTIEELEAMVDMAYLTMVEEGTVEARNEHFIAIAMLDQARIEHIEDNSGFKLLPFNKDRRKK